MEKLTQILDKRYLSRSDISYVLSLKDKTLVQELFRYAYNIKEKEIGTVVHFRGLIEFSNICGKNCYYCGLRSDNNGIERYEMTEAEVLEAAELAWKAQYGSIVLQSGEQSSKEFTKKVSSMLKKIKELSNSELGITLSCG